MNRFLSALLSVAVLLTQIPAAYADNKETTIKHVISCVNVIQDTSAEAVDNSDDYYYFEYDEYGRLLKADSKAYSYYERYYNPQFIYYVSIPGVDLYEYDENGNVSKVTRMNYDSEEAVVRFTVDYEYDGDRLDNETYTNGDKVVVARYIYDEDGNLERVERDEGTGNENYVKIGYHDSNGLVSSLRSKKFINNVYMDFSSTIGYNSDESISYINVASNYMMMEDAHIVFRYEDNGDIRDVKFSQGYFEIYYIITYEYEDIEVLL